MKNFFILSRDDKPERKEIIDKITDYIIKNGGSCSYALIDDYPYTIKEGTECIITIGGDGTFVRSVQRGYEHNVPFIGCNLGHLGFLCELDKESLYPSLDRLLNEKLEPESRMMLEGQVMDGAFVHAVNDVVLNCASNIQIARLSVHVNGQYLYSYNCDGIIISTPTGSTGYNLSAGGPIVNPNAETIVLTPINAHALNARSIVLGAEDEIKIVLEPRKRGNTKEKVEVKVDGALIGVLNVGDYATVKASKHKTLVYNLSNLSFVERIGKKMKDE